MYSEPREEHATTISLRRVMVSDLMSRNVICVRPQLSLDDAVQLFLETGLKAAPVVDEQGAVLGMVEESDVQLAVHAEVTPAASGANFEAPARSIADVMMPVSFAVHEQLSATQAAGLMVYESVHRVPVVSGDGKVVGIISASDLLYWLARADGYVLPSPRKT